MLVASLALALALALALSAACAGASPEESAKTISTYAARTHSIDLVWRIDKTTICDSIGQNCRTSRSNAVWQVARREDGSAGESRGFPVTECSTAAYRCLSGFIPLVFPRRPNAAGGKYSLLGFSFDYRCAAADDGTRCRKYSVSYRPATSGTPPLGGTFVYEIGFGVKSIMTLRADDSTPDAEYDYVDGTPFLAP